MKFSKAHSTKKQDFGSRSYCTPPCTLIKQLIIHNLVIILHKQFTVPLKELSYWFSFSLVDSLNCPSRLLSEEFNHTRKIFDLPCASNTRFGMENLRTWRHHIISWAHVSFSITKL